MTDKLHLHHSEYTVLLEVRVVGPDTNWSTVATMLAAKVADIELRGRWKVREVGIDEAGEVADA
jgi:hypothetical protein